jgi:hypothetical protein
MNPETKNCQNCKKDFIIEVEDFNFYEKMKVPAPTWCPECRMIRRFNFRNERKLFRRIDSHDGKEIFSTFSPEAKVVTFENSYWYGNDWDSLTFGLNYDFSKPFFEQFKILLSRAPILARSIYNLINSDYCNEASETKNSYLCFDCDFVENSAYLIKAMQTKDSFDLYSVSENELCYEDVMVFKSYQTFYSFDCESCVDVWFSKGLRGCTNCFGCVNLLNKSYCYFNEQLNKEDYNNKLKEINLGSYQVIFELRNKSLKFWLNYPNKYYHGLRTMESNGEQIYNSKNVKNCFSVKEGENLKYCQIMSQKASNSYDVLIGFMRADNMYECVTCGLGSYNLKFCFNCWEEALDLEYCTYCLGSKNCFGCVGLYKKEYCIFNKQYTKEEYFELKEKIIEQMNNVPYVDNKGRLFKYGEFFPYDISPTAYNESMAQDFFPIDEKRAPLSGLTWREPKLREFNITINSNDIPDDILNIKEDMIKEIIKCEKCHRAYKIIPIELQFYKRIGLPIPRLCHDCRFVERFKLINSPKLWHRSCMKEGCHNKFETSYAPNQPEIIYCEKCYQQEVY